MKKTSLLYLTQLSLLCAILLVMALTPLGYLRTPGMEITFLTVPVIVAANVLGPQAGAVLGGLFGITSFVQCFGTSGMGTVLLSVNPVFTALMCLVPRVTCGYVSGLIYQSLSKKDKMGIWSSLVSSLSCALLNTVLFMGLLVLFFWNSDLIVGYRDQLGTQNVLLFVVLFVGVQGAVEAGVCAAVGTALTKPLVLLNKRLTKKFR